MTHGDIWGGLPHEDAVWMEDVFCSIDFCSCLRTRNIFSGEDCNIPKFSPDIWNIRVPNFLNELSK